MRQYNCVVCRKKVKPKERRKVTNDQKDYYTNHLKVKTIKETDVSCNRCRHKFRKWKNTTINDNEMHAESDPNFSPPSTKSRPKQSPPSIFLQIPGVPNCHSQCAVCKSRALLTVISFSARIQAYMEKGVYISPGARCCKRHLDENGHLVRSCLDIMHTSNSIKTNRNNLTTFLTGLRESCNSSHIAIDFEKINDNSCQSFTGLTVEQFNDICNHLVPAVKNTPCRSQKTSIGLFLVKMKSGMSNSLLSAIFKISRSSVRRAIFVVRQAFMKLFVPFYLGFESLTREEVINNHTTDLAKTLLNSKKDEMILVLDGTYIYIQKSNNFLFQRRSYSLHKSRCLIKPMIIVTTTGYFVSILGPYFASNNDASILNHALKKNVEDIKSFVQENDIFVVDRGFRDSISLLEEMGIQASMPKFMKKGEKQMDDIDANTSRMVTKIRWVVESANARIKRFKFLEKVLPTSQVPYIGDYVRIVCAISNRYFRPLNTCKATDIELAEAMKTKCQEINYLRREVEEKGLDRCQKIWMRADEAEINFPRLTDDQLRDLTLGTYQIKLSPSYMKEFVDENSDIFIHKETDSLIKVKIQSRHVSSRKYQLWIRFNENEVESWYCKCKAGARVVGICSHIAAVVWYLSLDCKPDESIGVRNWGSYLDDAHFTPESVDSSDSDTCTNESQNKEE